MQLITLLSAVTAMISTASARSAVTENASCDTNEPHARIINRCDYDVYIWSVAKGDGCPISEAVTLKKGESYAENYYNSTDKIQGVSIKVSKTDQCKGSDIVQLEYFLERNKPGFNYNYLDVSYVDCLDGDCPTRQEGYFLKSGDQTDTASTASAGNTWCPLLSCSDPITCDKCSYVLPDDVQTKTCGLDQSMEFYMCGGDAPTDDEPIASAPVPASSSKKAASSAPASSASKPTTTLSNVVSSTADYDVVSSSAAYAVSSAVVTPAAEVKTDRHGRVRTKVVYVTAYEYVHAKRDPHAHAHAHAHGRRHQLFNA